jgi:plastocyanin
MVSRFRGARLLVNVPVLLLLNAGLAGCAGSPPVNHAPMADFVITTGASPGTYTLDAARSADPDGDPLTYRWDWQLGNASTQKVEVTIPPSTHNGTFPVVLVVRDDKGAFGTMVDKTTLVVGNGLNANPVVNIKDTVRWVKPGTSVALDSSASHDPDGDPLLVEWIWGPYVDHDVAMQSYDDPLKVANRTPQVFNSALLNPGASYSLTFDKAGVYDFVCHPHPWMQGRLIVDPDLPPSGDVTIDILGYAFANKTTRVGVGSTVTWRNRDPDQHTASAMDYTPGTKLAGTAPTFTQALDAGRFMVRMVVTDGKGGRMTASYGLKASDDAPPAALSMVDQVKPSEPATFAVYGQPPPTTKAFMINYTSVVSAKLTWTDPSGAATKGNLSLYKKNGGAVSRSDCAAPTLQVTGAAEVRLGPCRLSPHAPGEQYYFMVVTEQGTLAQWKVEMAGMEYLGPGFGDYNMARCHLNPPGPPHCI